MWITILIFFVFLSPWVPPSEFWLFYVLGSCWRCAATRPKISDKRYVNSAGHFLFVVNVNITRDITFISKERERTLIKIFLRNLCLMLRAVRVDVQTTIYYCMWLLFMCKLLSKIFPTLKNQQLIKWILVLIPIIERENIHMY